MKRQAYYILDPQTDTKQEGDEFFNETKWVRADLISPMYSDMVYRRPVLDAVTLDDGWIPWSGGNCPVDYDTLVQVKFSNGASTHNPTPARFMDWSSGGIISFYKVIEPAPKQPLTCDDVPPGSYLRPTSDYKGWCVISEIDTVGIHLHGGRAFTYNELCAGHWQIKRPGEDWKPCCK